MQAQHTVYLIPGQGADYRLYSKLKLDSCYKAVHIHYSLPDKNKTLPEFAAELAKHIDTTESFSLIGVSLGGMLATEISQIVNPEKTIIISSAKCRSELPARYRFMKHIPINEIVPPRTYYHGAKVAQPILEADRKNNKELFKQMLDDKDGRFLKRTTYMIVNWDRIEVPDNIIHIHGNNDHTLPLENVSPNYVVNNGSHMMVLTRGEEISKIINNILLEIE